MTSSHTAPYLSTFNMHGLSLYLPQPQAMIFVHLSLYCTFSYLWDMGSHHYEDQKIRIYWYIHISHSLREDHPLWLLTLPPMLVCNTSLLVQTQSSKPPVWNTYSNKPSCTWAQLRAYRHSQESLALRQFHGHFNRCAGCCWKAIWLTLPSAYLLFTCLLSHADTSIQNQLWSW